MAAKAVCRTYFGIYDQGYLRGQEWFGYGAQCDTCLRVLVTEGAADSPDRAVAAARWFGFEVQPPARICCPECRLRARTPAS